MWAEVKKQGKDVLEMMEKSVVEIRACRRPYLVLVGPWVVLMLLYVALAVRFPGRGLEPVVLLLGAISALWTGWLRGFKISLDEKFLEYRNGFYRSRKIRRDDIRSFKYRWKEIDFAIRKVKVPRVAVVLGAPRETVWINSPPFHSGDLERIKSAVSKGTA